MQYTYLLINFFTIIIPFVLSFHPKSNFYKTWHAFFPAVFFTGLYFIAWDAYFTSLGVWGFNPQYLITLQIYNLPVEEVLFFLCIPYACVFTFHCLGIYIKNPFSRILGRRMTFVLAALLTVLAVIYRQNMYTCVTFASLSILLLLAAYVFRVQWLPQFYTAYTILLLPFLVVNGLLTGTGLKDPVVWYNAGEITGARILTIPVEDIFYGMELLLANLLIYQFLRGRGEDGVLDTP